MNLDTFTTSLPLPQRRRWPSLTEREKSFQAYDTTYTPWWTGVRCEFAPAPRSRLCWHKHTRRTLPETTQRQLMCLNWPRPSPPRRKPRRGAPLPALSLAVSGRPGEREGRGAGAPTGNGPSDTSSRFRMHPLNAMTETLRNKSTRPPARSPVIFGNSF